ncbi:MAG TPA: hypothetical protein VFD98_13435 [Terracidiphilus sp.]|jgi:hypothetical protein|nr:hypothetical protein [Terracidiphilus sp.]
MATKHTDTCIQKAADDEPLFVLRAQDQSSPSVVMFWIACNFPNAPEDKLREAFDLALSMRKWPNRKAAD